jgi:hypothetical protein
MAQPSGLVEFVLSASGDEFDKNISLIMGMSRGFRLEPLKPKQP